METKIDLSPEALQKRREIAENATKGEWETITYGMEGNYVVISPIVDLKNSIATVKMEEDCFHIVANSPDAVIAMIDEIERLRERAEDAQVLEEEKGEYYRWFDNLAEACGVFKNTDPGKPETFQVFIDLFTRLEKEAEWLADKVSYTADNIALRPDIPPSRSSEYWRRMARKAIREEMNNESEDR